MTMNAFGLRYWTTFLLVLVMVSPVVGQTKQDPKNSQPASAALTAARDGAEVRLSLDGAAPFHVSNREVRGERLVTVADSPVRVMLWDELNTDGSATPFYAISLSDRGVDCVRETSYAIKLTHGEFEPLEQAETVSQRLRSPATSKLHIVQFVTQPLDIYRRQLTALGATVHEYLPNHAHIVRMDTTVRAKVQALPYVRWIGPYEPAYRLSPRVLRELDSGIGQVPTRRYGIQVFSKDIPQKAALADRIVALGGRIDATDADGLLVEATLTEEQLLAVAAMDEVLAISPWSPPSTRMNNVRVVGGANYLQSVGGYTGAGVRGEVMDNGCYTSHTDFSGRIAVRGDPVSTESHGTATFGIVFGSGAGSSSAKGMLPGAFGYFSAYDYAGTRYNNLSWLVTSPYNCVFQSNSWGHEDTTEYTTYTTELDRAVFDYDLLILHSQGNTGTQSGVEQAWGKNVVGVGGVYHNNDSSIGNDYWLGAGSIGPAADGRIKPDLCFYYESIYTTAPYNNYTSGFGGTSAACPETAGHFGLFFEMWKNGIFGNAVSGGTVFEERPHSSTARAMLINNAQSYSFSGTGHDLTRTHQGWGLPNVQNIYDRRDKMVVINESTVLQELESVEYEVFASPGEPLRATLVYTDIHGTTSAAQHRINDLTLKVTSPSAVYYYGNNGLLSGNWSTSGGSPNTKDTVENVFIQSPAAGIWTVEVIAAELNGDGHIETPETDADFALVITGASLDCNGNQISDAADIAQGTSQDCNANGTPDECEPGGEQDCNENSVPDLCDIYSGTSQDCLPNATPDECEADCNNDDITDECELAAGTALDCNGNTIPDYCDITVGTSADCNANTIPDECDVARCVLLWDGFPKNTAPTLFQPSQPMEGIDYIPYPVVGSGDGSAWDNNGSNSATTGTGYGCETGDENDLALTVNPPAGLEPENGYVISENFQDSTGDVLAPAEQVYSLSFRVQLARASSPYTEYNPNTDWQLMLYDAASGEAVLQMEFISTASTRSDTGLVPGYIAVKNPAGSPQQYTDTGIEIENWLWYCRQFEAVLDNIADTMTLYYEGSPVASISLDPGLHRMDYFRLQAIMNGNGASPGNDTSFRLDHMELCVNGGLAVAPSVYDCNNNGTLDACDLDNAISVDCDGDGVPDGCRIYGDSDFDGDIDLVDYQEFEGCLAGPEQTPSVPCLDFHFDFDCDDDVDMEDFGAFQSRFDN